MSSVALFPRHRMVHHEHCTISHCHICDGGLQECQTCGGLEAAMPTHCPQVSMSGSQLDLVYTGELDFDMHLGWVRRSVWELARLRAMGFTGVPSPL